MPFVSTHHHLSPGDTIRCRDQVARPGVPCLDLGTLGVCPASIDQACEIARTLVEWLVDREAALAVAAGDACQIDQIDLADMFERIWQELNGGSGDE